MMVSVSASEPAEQIIRATPSAAEPVYIGVTPESSTAAPSSSLSELVAGSSGRLEPDWDAWAEILAFGAPLAGRTSFAGYRRLQPGEYAQWDGTPDAGRWTLGREAWSWAEIEPEPDLAPEDLTGEVLEDLGEQIGAIEGPLNPMLSGGRDSRLLTAVALRTHGAENLTAWTTSSDTGTSMEELVAAKTAAQLGVDHRIVAARHADFSRDVRDYARTVDYMASFHIWLMPVARELSAAQGTVLDGLGGGIFLGGGFPDDPALAGGASPEQLAESRFERLGKYLDAADEVLAPGVADTLRERAWADFEPVARAFADHPNGATLTAYLTRTLPGISLAPSKVLGSARPVRMPIVGDRVIAAALRVGHSAKNDGAWYYDLLAQADPRLGDMPTAADLTKRRQHVRRGASREAAQWYRELLLDSPVAELLSERLRQAELRHWQDQLARTKPQHLLRGLAMLALWLEDYGPQLTSAQVPFGEGS